MPEGHGESGVEVMNTRQQAGAGPSRTSSVKSDAATGRQRRGTRRALQERQQQQQQQQQRQDVIDLTDDHADDDDVQITRVKQVKRPRVRSPGGAAALGGLHPTAALALAALVPGGVAALPLRVAPPAGAAALPSLNAVAQAVAAPAAPPPPPAPPSPKGYKCIICLERMESDLATTTCGHMFCYKCISAWVQKSGNCPQCRSKLTKSKIIRIYPPS